jgi:hypothetical protein
MERHDNLGLLISILLLLPALPVQAAMYKWYDEEGKLNYTQSPPPPGSRRATINTDSFSSVDMYKAPAVKLTNTSKKKRSKAKPAVKKKKKTARTTRSTCPLRR